MCMKYCGPREGGTVDKHDKGKGKKRTRRPNHRILSVAGANPERKSNSVNQKWEKMKLF